MNEMNNFRFTTKEERYRRMNRFFLLAVDLLFIIMLFYQIIQIIKPDKESFVTSWNVIVLVIFIIFNIIVFAKNQSTSYLKLYAAIEVAIEFIILSINPTATFLGMALIGVLSVLIPYYDSKFYNITLGIYTLLFTGSQIFRFTTKIEDLTASGICGILITYALFIVLVRTGSISKMFSDDALGATEEQSLHLSELLQEIFEISHTIKTEADSSTKMMNYLLESAANTAERMENISGATDITAENIEDQIGMTQNIQAAISDTKHRSEKMVSIATTSNEEIIHNQKMMEELKEQSAQITETNKRVTEAMAKLTNQTKEVEAIAGIILNISSQTNLLALNASIESARAGEAGRGFAVVADQIRQLSEETRKSTESISGIVNELNNNAEEVVNVTNSSVAAAQNQNSMIISAAESFGKLQSNITELLSDINEIDVKIEHLSEANNRIVENITNLSATTEEVTASADQTSELSKQNLEYTEQTKKAIALIQESANRLDKYTHQEQIADNDSEASL